MKRLLGIGCVLVMFVSQALSQSQPTLVLKNVNLAGLAGEGDQSNREIWIQGDKIVALRGAGNRPHGEATVVDCGGKWLIPGLIDMRVSLEYAESAADQRERDLQELLSYGITSVLDLSGSPSSTNETQAPARPRVFASATPLRGQAVSWNKSGSFIQNEKEARPAVQSAKGKNAALLFLDANLEASAVKGILKEASATGMLTAGAFLSTPFEEASKGGVNIIYGMTSLLSGFADGGARKKFSADWSHAEEALLSPKHAEDFFKAWQRAEPPKNARRKLQALANQAVFFSPQLALEANRLREYAQTQDSAKARMLREKYAQLLRLAFDLQVPLLAGTGYSSSQHWRPRLHEELEAWAAAGIAPRFALEAATINAGHALRQSNLGQIGEGMLADLVLLDEHPLKNLATLRRPHAVIADGKYIAQEELKQLRDNDRIALRELRAVLEWQVQAWNDGDLVRFMRGYWNNDSTLFASGGNVARGWQAMLARYQRGYPTREKMGKLEFTIYKTEMMGEDWARVLGQWKLTVGSTNPQGLFTLILRRFEEGWRIVHDHTSSATP